MALQSRSSTQSSALAPGRSAELSSQSNASKTSRSSNTGVRKSPGARPAPPTKGLSEENQIYQEYKEVEAMHEEKAIGLKSWSRKTRRTLYHVALCIAVLLPLVPSIVLLALLRQHPFFGGHLFTLVTHNRSTTQVIVTIVTAILAYLNIFVIANFLRACNVKLAENPVFKLLLAAFEDDGDDGQSGDAQDGSSDADSCNDNGNGDGNGNDKKKKEKKTDTKGILNELRKFWRSDHKLRLFLVGVLCFGLLSAPHLIWVGALTPIDAEQALTSTQSIYAPDFSVSTSSNWANNNKRTQQDCKQNFENSRFYDGCAATTLSGGLFSSMSTAAYLPFVDTQLSAYHSKQDLSDFTFVGRSFGVGSAIGLSSSDKTPYPEDLVGFFYQEQGYLTNVTCQYNSTSDWTLIQIQESRQNDGIPGIFQAQGLFPNSDWSLPSNNTEISYAVVSDDVANVVAWGTKSTDREHILAIAAGANYSNFNQIQCDIRFSPAMFNVTADVQNTIIEVDLILGSIGNPGDQNAFDSTQGLADTAVNQLAILSRLQTSPYSSDLGKALAENRASFLSVNANASESDPNTALRAVESAVEAALDDILGYVAGSQYFLDHAAGTPNASIILEATPVVQKIQIGDDPYIYLAMIGTGILVLAIIFKETFVIVYDRETFFPPPPKKSEKQPLMTMDAPTSGPNRGTATAVVTYTAETGSASARHTFSNV